MLLMSGSVGLRTSRQIALSDTLLRDQESKLQGASTWQGLTNANVVRVVASVINSDAPVNAAISSLDQMTQQNAALVEQSAAAAGSLNDQARRLSQSMGVFRLSARPARQVPAAAAPAAPRGTTATTPAHKSAHKSAHKPAHTAAAALRTATTSPAIRPDVAAQAAIQQRTQDLVVRLAPDVEGQTQVLHRIKHRRWRY